MAELLLGPLLRYAGETEALVWVETDSPCSVEVLDCRARTFEVEGHHYAIVHCAGLEVSDPPVRWRYVHDAPWFDNQFGLLELDGRHARLVLEKTFPSDGDEGSTRLEEVFTHKLA